MIHRLNLNKIKKNNKKKIHRISPNHNPIQYSKPIQVRSLRKISSNYEIFLHIFIYFYSNCIEGDN